MLIRETQYKDNESIAKVIRDIFHELDAPKVGTAYADPILDTLYEVYQHHVLYIISLKMMGKSLVVAVLLLLRC